MPRRYPMRVTRRRPASPATGWLPPVRGADADDRPRRAATGLAIAAKAAACRNAGFGNSPWARPAATVAQAISSPGQRLHVHRCREGCGGATRTLRHSAGDGCACGSARAVWAPRPWHAGAAARIPSRAVHSIDVSDCNWVAVIFMPIQRPCPWAQRPVADGRAPACRRKPSGPVLVLVVYPTLPNRSLELADVCWIATAQPNERLSWAPVAGCRSSPGRPRPSAPQVLAGSRLQRPRAPGRVNRSRLGSIRPLAALGRG